MDRATMMAPRAGTRAGRARTSGSPPQIDATKLRAALDDLGAQQARHLLDAALGTMPEAVRIELLGKHLGLARLRPDPPGSLLADARRFDAAVRGGEYYESFNVNSKNYMEMSRGTRGFITECNRLLARSVESSGSRLSDACAAFDLIFDLLRRIDEGNDDVFFADEAGSWQVGVAWETVLPAWFACLAKSADPERFGQRVARVVEEFEPDSSRKHYAAARRVATAAQRAALTRSIRAAQQETR